jgi:hypothetical protein
MMEVASFFVVIGKSQLQKFRDSWDVAREESSEVH